MSQIESSKVILSHGKLQDIKSFQGQKSLALTWLKVLYLFSSSFCTLYSLDGVLSLSALLWQSFLFSNFSTAYFLKTFLPSWWLPWWPARPPRPARRCPGPWASSGTSPSPPWSSPLSSATLLSSGLSHVITLYLFHQWLDAKCNKSQMWFPPILRMIRIGCFCHFLFLWMVYNITTDIQSTMKFCVFNTIWPKVLFPRLGQTIHISNMEQQKSQ